MESGRNPMSKHRLMGMENEQTEAGRDDRACLTIPNSQARMGTGENLFSLFS